MIAVYRLPVAMLRCRFTRWSVLLVYLGVACGFSVPLPFGKDLSQAFPCMLSHCGCRTAEQCWRSCCCHSLNERLAWAHEHGVQPPDYVLAMAEENSPKAKSSCCSHHAVPVAKTHSCCSSSKVPAKTATHRGHRDSEQGVSLLQALRCHGLAENWVGLAPTVMPDAVDCSLRLHVVEWLDPSPLILLSRDLAPPSPPPRLATA